MAAEDTRAFKTYRVIGTVEVKDGRSGEFVAPGGLVDLTEESRVLTIRTPNGLEPFEEAGTNVNALLYGGFIAEAADTPVKAEKKA